MSRQNRVLISILLTFCALPFAAHSQQPTTVGELLDKGGRKLSTEEVTKVLKGATIEGPQIQYPTSRFDLTLKEDGSATGHGNSPDNVLTGGWQIRGDGEVCTSVLNIRGQRFAGCGFYFVLENQYYYALRQDKQERLFERRIKRQ